MEQRRLLLRADLSGVVNAELHVSNCCLATAAWLRSEQLASTAQVFLAMSDQHLAIAHRLTKVCGRRGCTVVLRALEPPHTAHESVIDAALETMTREEELLKALHTATLRSSGVDRSLASGLVELLPAQRRLLRAAEALWAAALQHDSDRRLERWARKEAGRFRTMLSAEAVLHGRRAKPPGPTSACSA